ncbi:GAF domain-containing protein [Frankia sp. CNm7]|uniref:GAF domain-containing protein n=1 Tax=Frankia nepalensis TaxID=1836974 RepID=A0A937RFF0_9ACTN|nr:LuxR C-terminal-related transcriptional regulator [Frankia nepalensis]MBL7495948.1 GAF domain-containing protein [Frankia nepalensis]MBL7515135.1 GAF domain-containing protein [Frankia nepalensis]MBL7518856.1 GAF domain-containing protein [Frankia nepalensis]MBL7629197.1 GAF domain-containing protein [Frankia nepalensis]
MTSKPCDDTQADEFLIRITSSLRERTGADLALAGVVYPRTGKLALRCATGMRTDGLPGRTAPLDQTLAGRVVAAGRHVLVENDGKRARIGTRGPAWGDCGEDVRSLLAVPLRLDGRVLFVLYLGTRSDKAIGAATTRTALSFVSRLEDFVTQAARAYEIDAPQRCVMDIRTLRQIDGELEKLAKGVTVPHDRARIAAIRSLLEDGVLASSAQEPAFALTRRELDVLGLVAEGLSNAETAEQLAVSPETVKAYLRNIRSKLGVRNRTAAVSVARRYGLLW